MFSQNFLYFFNVTNFGHFFRIVLLLFNQSNNVLEGLHGKLFLFFVIFGHEYFSMIIDQLNKFIHGECNSIVFEFLKNLIHFFPIKSTLNVGLSEKTQDKLINSFETCYDENSLD